MPQLLMSKQNPLCYKFLIRTGNIFTYEPSQLPLVSDILPALVFALRQRNRPAYRDAAKTFVIIKRVPLAPPDGDR